eukprot:IDg11573t1
MERRETFRRIARDNLAHATANQKHYANQRRRDETFREGDLVVLSTKPLTGFKHGELPQKWHPKYVGPLRVTKVMGPVTYRIEMPPTLKKAHNVVHVSKLKPYHSRGITNKPLDITIDEK